MRIQDTMKELTKQLKSLSKVDMNGKVFFPYKDLTEEGFIHNDYLQEQLNNATDLVKKGWSAKESINYYF